MITCIKNSDFQNAAKEILESAWADVYKSRARRNANLMSNKSLVYELFEIEEIIKLNSGVNVDIDKSVPLGVETTEYIDF